MTEMLPPPPLNRSDRWQSSSISPNTIGRKLSEMWADIAAERRSGNRLSRAMADYASMRTQTVNLVVVTDSDARHDELAQLVTNLPDVTPATPAWCAGLDRSGGCARNSFRLQKSASGARSSRPRVNSP